MKHYSVVFAKRITILCVLQFMEEARKSFNLDNESTVGVDATNKVIVLISKIGMQCWNSKKKLIEQNGFTSCIQVTTIVLHPWLEVLCTLLTYIDVQFTSIWTNHNSTWCSFGFLRKSKTYLAEARLTWQKQDLPSTKQDLN